MLSRKIENVRAALGDLAGRVELEEWEAISACRRLLEDAQESAEELEARLVPASLDHGAAEAARG